MRLFFLILFSAAGMLVYCQDFNLGIQGGAGYQYFKPISENSQTPDLLTPGAGLSFEFSPYYSLLFVTSGAEYFWNDLGSGLAIPLTFRVEPGKKIRPFAEGGICYNIVINDIQDDFLVRNDLAGMLRLGVLLQLKNKFAIELSYYRLNGLTTGLEKEILLPLGQTDIEKYRRHEQGFSLRLKYQLY
jgi:hypothetical protein